MKRLIFLPLAIIISISAFSTSAAAQSTPEAAAKSFYKWYLTELTAQRDPITQNKKLLLGKISQRLGRWVYSKAYEEYGADYFIDAQDFDDHWADNVTATRASWNGKKAVVKVKLSGGKPPSGMGTRIMTIGLVLEPNATWKIDSVNNRPLVR